MASGSTATAVHDVVLRPGATGDVGAIRALAETVIPATYARIDSAFPGLMLEEWWSTERIATSLERNSHVVAERDGVVVGFANLGWLSESHRDLGHVSGDREVMWKLYVHPAEQGRGLGSRLLGAIEEQVASDALWLEVVDGNERAAAFYRAHGFAEVERVANAPWPDDVWFRKGLGGRRP